MSEDSLKKRFIYKLASSIFSFAIGIITVGIPARALGPTSYGDFTFLTQFFRPILNFFTFNTNIAYFTKISKRPEEKKIISCLMMM